MNPGEAPTSEQSVASPKILMVDDEVNILSGFRRTLGRKWNIVTAPSGAEALERLRSGESFAVIVTDMQMPEMNGIEFLERARAHLKDAICIMLTGNADQDTAAQAINRGHIFRFLNKPCSPDVMEHALALASRQYELVTAERVLLRDTLTGAIRVLNEAMGYSRPGLNELSNAVRKNAHSLGDAVGLSGDWRLNLSSSLCLIGFAVLHHVKDSDMLAEHALKECASCGARLIRFIPRLLPISDIVRRQRDRLELPNVLRHGFPEEWEVLCTQILRWSVDIERVRAGRLPLAELLDDAGSYTSPLAAPLKREIERAASVQTADAVAAAKPYVVAQSSVHMLTEGMVLDRDVVGTDGRVLLAAGFVLTNVTIERLTSLKLAGIIAPLVATRTPIHQRASAA